MKIKCKHCRSTTSIGIGGLSKLSSGHYDYSFKCPYCGESQFVSYEHSLIGRRKVNEYNNQRMVDDIEYLKDKFNKIFGNNNG